MSDSSTHNNKRCRKQNNQKPFTESINLTVFKCLLVTGIKYSLAHLYHSY